MAKIADFGVSRVKGDYTSNFTTQVGTYSWSAPGKIRKPKFKFSPSYQLLIIFQELLEGKPYDEKVDVWSFGAVLYELTTKEIPNPLAILISFLRKSELPIPEGIEIDPTLRELMNQCLNLYPQQRPSFSQIVQTLRNAMSQNNTNTKQ
jgi:sterile alpha motif and leucine zipper-containing kinase AZK